MNVQSKKVLIIEDDADGQIMLASLIGHLNYAVDVASNAEEAEKYLFESGAVYDAAIIDLALPDKDGWQILAEIRGHSQTANLPCMAATAYHTSKLREDAISAGFKAYFPKPIDGTKLLHELERILS
jgi:CheY-like chemotaxis protein